MISNSVLIRSVNQHDLFVEFNQLFAISRGIIFTNQWNRSPRRPRLSVNET